MVDPKAEQQDNAQLGKQLISQMNAAGNNPVLVTKLASRSVSNTKLPRRAPPKAKELNFVMEYDERTLGS